MSLSLSQIGRELSASELIHIIEHGSRSLIANTTDLDRFNWLVRHLADRSETGLKVMAKITLRQRCRR